MTAARIAGLVLVVVGLVGLLWGGFSWTRERTVVQGLRLDRVGNTVGYAGRVTMEAR
jgi:hypothetical protein